MERKEIEAELNDIERDLADIARRAHIAASNLRSVAETQSYFESCRLPLKPYALDCERIADLAGLIRNAFLETRATAAFIKAKLDAEDVAEAAGKGGGRGMIITHKESSVRYDVEVIDDKDGQWRVLSSHERMMDAEAVSDLAATTKQYHKVRLMMVMRKEVAE